LSPKTLSAILLLLVTACGPSTQAEVSGVVRDRRTGTPIAGARVRADRGGEAETDAAGAFRVSVPVGSDQTLRVLARGYCPSTQRVTVATGGRTGVRVHVAERLVVRGETVQAGFDAPVTVEAVTRCDDDAVLRWTQTSGPPLGGERMQIEEGGRKLVIKTHRLEELRRLDDRVGVVALSRHERGDYRFELEAEIGGEVVKRAVRVVAAPTSAGVYQVPTGADLYFNGGTHETHRWVLMDKPRGSEAELLGAETRTPRLRPDRFGQYLLRHEPSFVQMNIQAGPYEDVPHDCGRSRCHQAEDEGWTRTAHADTFRRGIEGALGESFDVACWTCHATGVEPGVQNGGLHNTATRLQWRQPDPHAGTWDAAPRLIRRHGSVWCSSCHGPGRILPPPFKWEYGAKFQEGVCVRCHDAAEDPDSPHESLQAREWRLAAMAGFVRGGPGDESDPARRSGCARCHSAQGFVEWRRRGDTRFEPDPRTVTSITCAACHDAHGSGHPAGLRAFEESEPVAGRAATGLGLGAICVSCHRANAIDDDDEESIAPHAPQSDVLLGRGSRLLPRFEGGPHARVAGSCVSCHMAQPPAGDPLRGRAGGHTFAIRDRGVQEGEQGQIGAAACASCHGTGVPPQAIGGLRDWDGDGANDNVGVEHQRALRRVREQLRERIGFARVFDECQERHLATDWVEHEGVLRLIDAESRPLGDCDRDGTIGPRERPVEVEELSRQLMRIVWDVAMLEKDGSHGRHNPTFAFAILREARNALRE
jgi:hypothetical protein